MLRSEAAQIVRVVLGIVLVRATISALRVAGIIVMDLGQDVGSHIIGNAKYGKFKR